MRINWEDFEETLQELSEELSISNPKHEDFVAEFTERVDDLIAEHKMKAKDREHAVQLAADYGYEATIGEDEEDLDE